MPHLTARYTHLSLCLFVQTSWIEFQKAHILYYTSIINYLPFKSSCSIFWNQSSDPAVFPVGLLVHDYSRIISSRILLNGMHLSTTVSKLSRTKWSRARFPFQLKLWINMCVDTQRPSSPQTVSRSKSVQSLSVCSTPARSSSSALEPDSMPGFPGSRPGERIRTEGTQPG